jgi:hypothetical protein
MPIKWFPLALCLAMAAACSPAPPPEEPVIIEAPTTGDGGANYGAVSVDEPVLPEPPPDIASTTDWPAMELTSGEALISCTVDYEAAGDGQPLVDLGFEPVTEAMQPCQEAGVLRLSYTGKVAPDFASLIERVAVMADRMEIDKRILDIDSSGGQVEAAIRAGDLIAESGWTIWVREDAICHSSCVLVLAGGDNRLLSGKVGVHRIFRLHSDATSRAELSRELQEVHSNIEQYLARNGVAVAVADLMMTVPNRSLRLLTEAELDQYGIAGINAAQDDLDRIRLARKCGEDFVRRRDNFFRSFDRSCATAGEDLEAMNTCGLELRERFGFPDDNCRLDSPFAELDVRSHAAAGSEEPAVDAPPG